jgi:hypothetical protein
MHSNLSYSFRRFCPVHLTRRQFRNDDVRSKFRILYDSAFTVRGLSADVLIEFRGDQRPQSKPNDVLIIGQHESQGIRVTENYGIPCNTGWQSGCQ